MGGTKMGVIERIRELDDGNVEVVVHSTTMTNTSHAGWFFTLDGKLLPSYKVRGLAKGWILNPHRKHIVVVWWWWNKAKTPHKAFVARAILAPMRLLENGKHEWMIVYERIIEFEFTENGEIVVTSAPELKDALAILAKNIIDAMPAYHRRAKDLPPLPTPIVKAINE